MGSTLQLAKNWLRAYVADGIPSSGPNQPSKTDGITTLTDVDTRLTNVEAIASGIVYKAPVRFAITGVLPAYTYANGAAGVGATITSNANVALGSANCDGVTPVVGDRCWVWSPTGGSAPEYGLYTVTTIGSGSVKFVLTRATDANTTAALGSAAAICLAGATYTGFVLAQTIPANFFVVGTTPLMPVVVGLQTAVAAETARALAAEALLAPLNSPVFVGTPQAPTPAAGDHSNLLATTAFVSGGGGLLSGFGPPSNSLGNDGQFYYDNNGTFGGTIGQVLYGPKGQPTPGVWPAGKIQPQTVSSVITVPYPDARFADLQAALDFFLPFRFSRGGSGVIQLAAGLVDTLGGITNRHPQGPLITIQGANPGSPVTRPDATTWSGTFGTDLATIQATWPTTLKNFSLDQSMGGGISLFNLAAGNVTGAGTGGLLIRGENGANIRCTNCCFFGGQRTYNMASGANLFLNSTSSLHCSYGFFGSNCTLDCSFGPGDTFAFSSTQAWAFTNCLITAFATQFRVAGPGALIGYTSFLNINNPQFLNIGASGQCVYFTGCTSFFYAADFRNAATNLTIQCYGVGYMECGGTGYYNTGQNVTAVHGAMIHYLGAIGYSGNQVPNFNVPINTVGPITDGRIGAIIENR